jgi:rhodanese-related sulfurtransferase
VLPWIVGALVALAAAGPAAGSHPWVPMLLTIDAESLHGLAGQGRPVVPVDVRPDEAFRHGRLPGARSIPLTTLRAREREVPAGPLVVLYGETLAEAAVAYRALRAAGHANVVVLEGGFAAWQTRGYEVER